MSVATILGCACIKRLTPTSPFGSRGDFLKTVLESNPIFWSSITKLPKVILTKNRSLHLREENKYSMEGQWWREGKCRYYNGALM